jgi:hypothetical protein
VALSLKQGLLVHSFVPYFWSLPGIFGRVSRDASIKIHAGRVDLLLAVQYLFRAAFSGG